MDIARPVRTRSDSGETTVACDITVGGERRQAWYRTAVPLDHVGVEPFVCLSVIPAMRTGEHVAVHGGPVSAKMLAGVPRVQAQYAKWYPELKVVPFDALPQTTSPGHDARGVGCFFSGGVDSFYSVLQHADEVDTVIFAHGFDVPLANTNLRDRVSTQLRAAAGALGKRLIEVETNAREFLDPFGNWGKHTHGPALASVAHLLAGEVRKVYIPSSGTRDEDLAWGSHSAVDPLWSSEAVEIVHDDDTVNRFQKTAFVARSPVALAHLRVCWENRDNAYNCGRCEKCLRTMLTLRLNHALDRCKTFEAPLDLDAVSKLTSVQSVLRRRFYEEILQGSRANGDHEMADAVHRALFPPKSAGKWVVKKARGVKRRMMSWLR
jgi:hypothetical protein